MTRGLGSRGAVVAAAAMVALALAACGEDSPDESSESNAEEPLEDVEVIDANPAEVRAIDNNFDGENIQVAPGTKVVWTNQGANDHDIVPSEDGEWGVEASEFAPSATYEYMFNEPGTYRYYCSLHGTADAGMTGAVVVKD